MLVLFTVKSRGITENLFSEFSPVNNPSISMEVRARAISQLCQDPSRFGKRNHVAKPIFFD
jgi:hypothetical protein